MRFGDRRLEVRQFFERVFALRTRDDSQKRHFELALDVFGNVHHIVHLVAHEDDAAREEQTEQQP